VGDRYSVLEAAMFLRQARAEEGLYLGGQARPAA
jgi:hypothetical protein